MEGGDVITVLELKSLIDKGGPVNLIDVRELNEYQLCHIDSSVLIPLSSIPGRISEFDVDAEYIVYCHTGQRSAWVAEYLRRRGIKKVRNLDGGIDAWAERIDSSMARY